MQGYLLKNLFKNIYAILLTNKYLCNIVKVSTKQIHTNGGRYMVTYNFCRKMDIQTKISIDKWARRLDAEEMTVHKDGSVTLINSEGYICENYRPSAKELNK